MVRSAYRLPLLYPIVFFSLVAYGQIYAAAGAGSPKAQQQDQQQQQTNGSPAAFQQSAPTATDSLPDDPATTARIQVPVAPEGPTIVFDTSMGE